MAFGLVSLIKERLDDQKNAKTNDFVLIDKIVIQKLIQAKSDSENSW